MTAPDAQEIQEGVGAVLDTAEAGKRVLTGGAIRVVGYGAGLIASLIAAAVMLRHLAPADYGRFATVTALVTSIQLVTDLGMTVLGVREYAQREGADRDHFMRVLLGMRVVTSTLLVGASALLSVALGYDHEMVLGAVLMGVAVSIAAVTGTVGIPLQVEIRMGVVTGIDVARQVATSIAFIALSLAGAGIVAFLGISAPIYLVVLLVTFWFVRGVPLQPTFAPAEWLRLLRPTLVFALAAAVGAIYVYTAMVLTQLVTTQVETGYFGASFRVFMIVATFPALLASTAFPLLSRAARDDQSRLAYAGQRLMEGSALLGGAALVGLVLGSEVVMNVLGSSGYDGAIPVLRVQGVALALTFVISSFGYTLLALHRHRGIIYANLCSLTVSATGVLLLGHAHGAVGASYGVLLGEATLATAYLVALGRGGENLRPTPGRAVRTIPPITAALLCWFLPLPPLAITLIGLAVYAAGVVLCRAIPDEILALIPRRNAAGDDTPEPQA